jgi:hypothetical protein
MTAYIEKSTADEVIAIDASNKAEKASFTVSKARTSEAVSEYDNSNSNNIDEMMNIPALMAPSTYTTLSSIATKIEDQSNETEILLLELTYSSDIDVNKDNDNETCSVSSSTSSVLSRYFEPTDFLPWEELYSKAEYAPHVGFVMVAGGFAFLHPVIFFAGVVTAVGTVKAAGATYEYVMCKQPRQTKTQGLEGDDSNVYDLTIPCDCFMTSLGLNVTNQNVNFEAERLLSPDDSKSEDADTLPALAKSKSYSTCSTNASTIGDLSHDANLKTGLAHVPGSCVPDIIKSPSKVQRIPEDDPTRWVTDNFPVLPIIALENVEFRGLNAHEFFDVFFADDAPFGFPAFHVLRRDKEVQYSSWNTGVTSDKPNSNSIEFPPSIHAKERLVEYHAKTNSFLGPAYAPTKKTQRAYFVSKKMLVIEIRMTLHDIPFSKQFYLIERWVIDGTRGGFDTIDRSNTMNSRKKDKKNGNNSTKASSSHSVYLTVSSEVYFTQECTFESAVKKESTKQVCEIAKCWNAMAQAGLKRTEETRKKRLRQEEEKERTQQESPTSTRNNNNENNECIEIEHLDKITVNDHSNDRGGSRGRRSTENRRRSSTKHVNQNPTQSLRRFQNRSLSQSFSKYLARGRNSSITRESTQKLLKNPPLKVRISSAGVSSC